MCKYPYVQFYQADWIADTRILSLPARAVWLELILAMHQRGRTGTLTGTTERLAGLCGCSVPELTGALEELVATGTADMSRNSHGLVTVICRRMQHEQAERDSNTERQRKSRLSRNCHAIVTGHSTEDRVQRKENIPVGDIKEKPPADDPIPHSIEDVLEIAGTVFCGLPCSREQADAYFTDRVARDWIPHGQSLQLKNKTQIAADLKKWLMRDKNERRNKGGNPHRYFTNNPAGYDPADDGSNY